MEDKVTEQAIETELKSIKENLDNKFSEAQLIDIIKNQNFSFIYNEVYYRMVKPTQANVTDMYAEVAKKKTQMLLNSELLPMSVLKKKWLIKGIDINEMENQVKKLRDEKEKFDNSLGKLLEDSNASEIDAKKADDYKRKILEIKQDINRINSEIASYFDMSLETQLNVFQYMYMSYLMAQKGIVSGNDADGKPIIKYEKAFKTFEEYGKADPLLVEKLNIYTVLMSRDVISEL